jgi:hypothetical protein
MASLRRLHSTSHVASALWTTTTWKKPLGSRALTMMTIRQMKASSIRAAVHTSTTTTLRPGGNLYTACRFFSTAEAATKATTTAATITEAKPKDDSNVFLDNLGKIFLSAIGLLIASLVRSYHGTQNRTYLRDWMEEHCVLDPLEVDDLRVANSELKIGVFRSILQALAQTNSQEMTYEEFVTVVRRTMHGLKGEHFTIELGHYMDRVVLATLERHNKSSQDAMPVLFWLTLLSLALHSSVPERIQVLYECLQLSHDNVNVTVQDVTELVGYLQDTCQLVPDSQIVATETKYPVQQYTTGTAEQLVAWQGSIQEPMDIDSLAEILRSKSVCAWGECYHKKKNV